MLAECQIRPRLIDHFSRVHDYLRLAVTDRCNLRCRYCMPAGGWPWRDSAELLTLEEIVRLARLFVEMGVRKIRLTGGEPTVRPDIIELVAQLAGLPGLETLALTTNGVSLSDLAVPLRTAGLQAINVSLDSLQPARFRDITGCSQFLDVMDGIEAALAAGFTPLKINTVVMGGVNEDELLDFVEFIREKPVNVRFIEYMPFSGNGWSSGALIPLRQMLTIIGEQYPLQSIYANGVAKDYRIPGFLGTVSFISPMSADFCAGCSRLRLTADGSVKTCLFSSPETGLRDALRNGASDDALCKQIHDVLQGKPAAHPPAEEISTGANRCMIDIGG